MVKSTNSVAVNSAVRDMCALVHGFHYRGKITAVLFGFFDGSSTHAGSKIWTLCGFLGEFSDFETLDEKWNKVLNKPHWPSRPSEFHMYDCVHARGELDGWTFAERLALFGDLATIVAESNLHALGSIVIVDDLARLAHDEMELLQSERLGTPIDLTLQYILQNALRYTKKYSLTEDIGLIFDQEPEVIAQQFLAFSDHYRNEFGKILAGIGFGDSAKWTPLQAADMLAYCTYRLELRRRFPTEAEPEFPVLPRFARLILEIAPAGGGYDFDSMKKLVELIKQHPKGNFSL
jgi:hypothetical protein